MSEQKQFGNRGKGRPKGSKNKNKYDVAAKLDLAGCDPVTEMVQMIRDPDVKPEVKANLLKELVKYIAPQQKAVEVSGDADNPVALKIIWEGDLIEDVTEEEDDDNEE